MGLKVLTDWMLTKETALDTVGKISAKRPDSLWKYQILYAEHSPMRNLLFKWTWNKIKYWVSTHFVRHKIGIEHFVKTQRSDRTGVDRNEIPQDALVKHTVVVNAQAIINISRVRLCKQASKETTEKWKEFLEKLRKKEPELADVCVPNCVYRGFCPELVCCGYHRTNSFKRKRDSYVNKCMTVREERAKKVSKEQLKRR